MIYKFNDLVIDSRTGLNPRKNFKLGKGNNNYITIKDIQNGKIVISDKTDKIDDEAIQIIKKRSRIKNGDILFSSIGRVGDTAIVNKKDDSWDVNESVFIFTINKELITPEYFCHLLGSQATKDNLSKNSTGSTFKSVKMGQLNKMTFEVPSIQKQQKITDQLNKLQCINDNRKEQLFEYDQLIKSRFVEMFGDIFNGKSNYSTIKISEAVVPKIERAKKDFNADDEIKYLDISSVDNRKNIIIGYTDYLMKEAPSRAQQHVRKDDIVISTIRPNLNNVAKVTHDYSNIVASSGFCVLRASKVEPNFLFALVSMQSFADYLASLTTGANYPAVSDKDILNFEIPNAPFEEQTKFSDFIKQVDKLKFVVQQSLDETQKLFDSLMQKYFG